MSTSQEFFVGFPTVGSIICNMQQGVVDHAPVQREDIVPHQPNVVENATRCNHLTNLCHISHADIQGEDWEAALNDPIDLFNDHSGCCQGVIQPLLVCVLRTKEWGNQVPSAGIPRITDEVAIPIDT